MKATFQDRISLGGATANGFQGGNLFDDGIKNTYDNVIFDHEDPLEHLRWGSAGCFDSPAGTEKLFMFNDFYNQINTDRTNITKIRKRIAPQESIRFFFPYYFKLPIKNIFKCIAGARKYLK